MDRYNDTLRNIAGLLGGVTGFLFGEFTLSLKVLVALMALDFVSGVTAAVVKKKVSSKVGFVGIAKKLFILSLVAVAHLIDGVTVLNGLCMNMVAFFYIANEAMSIIENAGRMGVPIPEKLLETVAQLNGKEG